MAHLEEPHERFEAEERIAERKYEAQMRDYEDAMCMDCDNCTMPTRGDMQPHVKYVIDAVRKFYVLRPDVQRTEASVEYDIARCCENARLLMAWCSDYKEFVDAEMPARECERFIRC